MRITLCDPDAKIAELATLRCGVRCQTCCWSGYRLVGFVVNVGHNITLDEATEAVRERGSSSCPKCGTNESAPGRGRTEFTHAAGYR